MEPALWARVAPKAVEAVNTDQPLFTVTMIRTPRASVRPPSPRPVLSFDPHGAEQACRRYQKVLGARFLGVRGGCLRLLARGGCVARIQTVGTGCCGEAVMAAGRTALPILAHVTYPQTRACDRHA